MDMMNKDLANQILEQLPTPVMAINRDYEIIFMNRAGCRMLQKTQQELLGSLCYHIFDSEHCNTENCRMKCSMDGEASCTVRNRININGKSIPIEYTTDTLKDSKGNIVGGLEYIIDITDTVEKERKMKEQSRTILEISTPVTQLWDKILILPIIGVIDSYRAQQMMDSMLNKLKETESKIIILDIQGVAAMDTAVANHLIKIAKATRLMGCTCIISGISPAVAQTLVQLGIDLGSIMTNTSLQEALADAFRLQNLDVSQKES
ncbi:MAG: STAS domain-containing protein [Spirochaetales bacterium]|nr:STAS domain-containing protein [Spirochaetales bacterium]